MRARTWRRRSRAPVALALALALGVSGCASGEQQDGDDLFRGVPLSRALDRPDVVLVATDGQPYDLAERTAGRVTVVLPAFTSCDDECPAQLADIAAGLAQLEPEQARDVDVVMITTDPARDDPATLRAYLDGFDGDLPRDWVGLTGDPSVLGEAYADLGVPPPEPEEPAADGSYQVRHLVSAFAFGRDGTAHLGYPLGTTPATYAHDLRLLLDGREPPEQSAEQAAADRAVVGGQAAGAGLTVLGAFVDDDGSLRLSLRGTGGTAVQVVGLATASGEPVAVRTPSGQPRPLGPDAPVEVGADAVVLVGEDGDLVAGVPPDAVPDDGGTLDLAVTVRGDAGETVLPLPVPRSRS